MTVRLYFDKRAKKPWSLDEGTGTPERNYSSIIIDQGVAGITKYTGPKPSDQVPVAWIQFTNAAIQEHGDAAVITKAKR